MSEGESVRITECMGEDLRSPLTYSWSATTRYCACCPARLGMPGAVPLPSSPWHFAQAAARALPGS